MTFSSRYSIGTQTSVNDIANALDDITADPSTATNGGSQTINSGSFTDLTGMSITKTIGTGESVLLTFQCNIDQVTATDEFTFQFTRDGTALGIVLNMCAGSVGGANYGTPVALSWIDILPSSGAHTYKVQCKRLTGAGNGLITDRSMCALVVQGNS